ncbi:hypothetical protein RB213_014314 [Colletotrichum asianum]
MIYRAPTPLLIAIIVGRDRARRDYRPLVTVHDRSFLLEHEFESTATYRTELRVLINIIQGRIEAVQAVHGRSSGQSVVSEGCALRETEATGAIDN